MNEARDINTLSRETGISVRTIRYYLAQDLLPPPAGRGPAATYGSGHRAAANRLDERAAFVGGVSLATRDRPRV